MEIETGFQGIRVVTNNIHFVNNSKINYDDGCYARDVAIVAY